MWCFWTLAGLGGLRMVCLTSCWWFALGFEGESRGKLPWGTFGWNFL